MNELLMVKGKYIEHYISNNKRYHQFASHFLLIVLTWYISKYIAVGPFLKDNEFIISSFCIIFTVQTIAIYYFFALFAIPKYLYEKKIALFIFCFLLSFLFIYWSNYLAFVQLLPYSNAVKHPGMKDLWIAKIGGLVVNDGGWFGCFTSLRVAFWNFGFSFEISLIYLSIKVFRDVLTTQRKNLTLERDNLALELNFLKSQINPHFLFNTLNSIYTRTVDVDEQASDIVLKLSDLMRYSLYGANEEKVPLEDEMAYIQNYLDLEKYRHSQNLVDISFAMDGTVTGYKIAPLLLISFVENAFKHGVNLSRKASFVHVSAVIEESKLYFTVQNSLPDSNESASRKSDSKNAGIGLVNTRKRLEMIYPDRHEINIAQTEREYEVMLSIELS